jgi:hypothetical protein
LTNGRLADRPPLPCGLPTHKCGPVEPDHVGWSGDSAEEDGMSDQKIAAMEQIVKLEAELGRLRAQDQTALRRCRSTRYG